MKHSIVTITPTYAAQLLESNSHNRKLDDRLVADYAKEMSHGKWEINGETIKISKTGILLDGQHRLNACVRSGHDLVTMMVEGLDEHVFTTINRGKKRSIAQILAMEGCKNAAQVGSAIKWVNWIETGKIRPVMSGNDVKPTAQETLEWLQAHTFIIEAVKAVVGMRHLSSVSITAAVYYLLYMKDANLCVDYFKGLVKGENIRSGDAAFAIRNRLISKSRDPNISEQAVLLVRGWNAFRHNEKMHNVVGWVKNSSNQYTFPDIE